MLRIRRRLVAWVLLAIGLPLLAEGLRRAADTLEARRGTTPASRGLRLAGHAANNVRRYGRR